MTLVPTGHTSLYRFFNAKGELLYVGITGTLPRRFREHEESKLWWFECERVTVQHFATREAAAIAEIDAIRGECPRYNVVYAQRSASALAAAAPPSSGVWRFRTRRGRWKEEPLYLYPELDGSSVIGDSACSDGEEALYFYVGWIEDNHPEWLEADAVPIYWSVMPVCEHAPFQAKPLVDEDFLSFYTWPLDAATGERLDWYRLAVVNDRFRDFAKALSWLPSPLQPTAPLRSIMESRRGQARHGFQAD